MIQIYCFRTTKQNRKTIWDSKESTIKSAVRHHCNPKTVQKWRKKVVCMDQ